MTDNNAQSALEDLNGHSSPFNSQGVCDRIGVTMKPDTLKLIRKLLERKALTDEQTRGEAGDPCTGHCLTDDLEIIPNGCDCGTDQTRNGAGEWRDISTAPRDGKMFYLLDVADDMHDTSDKLKDVFEIKYGRVNYCKYGCWSSIYKAIGWHDPRIPAIPAAPLPQNDEGEV